MTSPGGARELPAGRLANFEGDDAIDLSSLLPRRTTTEQSAPATPGPDDSSSSPSQPPASSPAVEQQPAAPGRGRNNGTTKASAATAPARKTAAKKTTGKKRGTTDSSAPADGSGSATAPAPAPSNPVANRANLIKPSSAQIPSALIPLIARRRDETGRSNGEIVLDAIEATHPDLATLLHPRGQAGGGLFAARASRGVRKVDGPLTGLNIRLYEQDYDVIDQLVAQFGALSRGHLISVALTAFLHEDSTE